MRTIHLLILAASAAVLAPSVFAVDLPHEFWVNDKAGWTVETKPCDTGLCGYLVDFPSAHTVRPDGPEKDVHNPDKSKRAQPMCGMLLMGGFKPAKAETAAWKMAGSMTRFRAILFPARSPRSTTTPSNCAAISGFRCSARR